MDIDIDNIDKRELQYHVSLCVEAGLLDGVDANYIGSGMNKLYAIQNLTWNGHEFLDAVRSEGIWNTAKQRIVDEGGSFTFEILRQIAVATIKSKLGIDW